MAYGVPVYSRMQKHAFCGMTRQILTRRALTSAAATSHWHITSPALLAGLSRLGVVAPTSVQAEVLPIAAAQGKDVLAISQTGSGKTLMFLLPLLQRLSDAAAPCSALVLAPTSALATQHAAVAKALASADERLSVECIAGDAASDSAAAFDCRLVVTTPAVVLAMARQPAGLAALRIAGLGAVAIDEVDACLCGGEFEEGLSGEGEAVLEAVERLAPREPAADAGGDGGHGPVTTLQYLLTTAHLSKAHEAALARRFPRAVRVGQRSGAAASGAGTLVPTLRQAFHYFRGDRRAKLLSLLRREAEAPSWRTEGTTLLFCADAARATATHAAIVAAAASAPAPAPASDDAEGSPPPPPLLLPDTLLLHEDQGASARDAALAAFGRCEAARLLVCSTAMARGLDMPHVAQHGQSGRLGEAMAGLHGLVSLHLKA